MSDTILPGRIDLGRAEVPRDAQIYLCGPLPFMAGIRRTLAEQGVPDARIHYEAFGTDTWLAAA